MSCSSRDALMRFAMLALLLGGFACSPSTGSATAGDGGTTDSRGGGTHTDAFVQQDAPAGPFGCLGQPVPTTAPDPVTLAGSAQTIDGTDEVPAKGVKITAQHADGSTIASTTTDANGAYSLAMPTGGDALDVHLTATKSGDRDTALYPATTLYTDTNAGYILIISETDFDYLAQASGQSQSSSKAAIAMGVIDCDGTALAGATVTTSPAGTVVYLTGGSPDQDATSTDSSGVALVFNVPAGAVTVSASVSGMTLRSHSINAAAGVTTTAAIRP